MIDVTTNWWLAVVIAGFFGLLGGLVNEFTSSHTPAELALGRVELWGGKRLHDFGFWASMIVGAVTAIAFLYFLEPKSVTVAGETTREYDGIKLVAAALLVGSGGPAVLKSLRERLLRVQSEATNAAAYRIAKDVDKEGKDSAERLNAISSVLEVPGSD